MAILERYSIVEQSDQGHLQIFKVVVPGSDQPGYLLAEPEESPTWVVHPALGQLRPTGSESGRRWLQGPAIRGQSLRALRRAGSLDETQQLESTLSLVEVLVHLAGARPALLPMSLEADHLYRTMEGSWVLDICALALAPGQRLGSGANLILAVGEFLKGLYEEEMDRSTMLPPLSPALRFVMNRCLGGGFASLYDLESTLQRIRRSSGTGEPRRAEPRALPPPSQQETAPWFTGQKARACLGATLAIFLALSLWVALGGGRAMEPAQSGTAPIEPAAPRVETAGRPFPTEGEPAGQYLTAEPAFTPSAAPAPAAAVKPATHTSPPAPAAPLPLEPLDALDRAIAGEHRVTLRLTGKSLGEAYMFTNPPAPVISLDKLALLLGRPIDWKQVGPQQIQLASSQRSIVTGDFQLLNNRVWLVLRPELLNWLGLKIIGYNDQVVDLDLHL